MHIIQSVAFETWTLSKVVYYWMKQETLVKTQAYLKHGLRHGPRELRYRGGPVWL